MANIHIYNLRLPVYSMVGKAGVTHSRFSLPSLKGPFPIKMCQKSDQDLVNRGWKFDLYLSLGKIRPSLSRLRPDSTECNPTEIR